MKQSELLRKQADMMDMAEKYGVKDWLELVKVRDPEKFEGYVTLHERIPSAKCLQFWPEHKFALAVVEGKPVFDGDGIYTDNGTKFIAGGLLTNKYGVYLVEQGYFVQNRGVSCPASNCTWNPPKPKTVMVELLVEDVKSFADCIVLSTCNDLSRKLYAACGKALESKGDKSC